MLSDDDRVFKVEREGMHVMMHMNMGSVSTVKDVWHGGQWRVSFSPVRKDDRVKKGPTYAKSGR